MAQANQNPIRAENLAELTRFTARLCVSLMFLALAACASNNASPVMHNHAEVEGLSVPALRATFQAADQAQPGYAATGLASWYGRKYHGRKTASGQPFDMYALTAAHRSLPFGTEVTVTNLENGRQVAVTITDRGPFSKSRIIDLSFRAAETLDFVKSGTARVRLEIAASGETLDNTGEETAYFTPTAIRPRITEASQRFSCVPYARAVSGLAIRGDAWTWWQGAGGKYHKGLRPAPNAVLVMGRTRHLSRGHLAIVTKVLNDRQILVTQANWLGKGRIHSDVPVVDVSPANDWSEVRVWHSPTGTLGVRRYAVSGFIYPQAPRPEA